MEYLDLEEVFSTERATQLPQHKPCSIELLSNAMPPKSKVYPLFIPENRAMDKYIQEALTVGYTRPSMSPTVSGFFFIEKKDGGLRPCIDCQGLNAIMVRYPYPLPLVIYSPNWEQHIMHV